MMPPPEALLGRQDEERRLARNIAGCEPTVVYGLAGVGKSALVQTVYGSLGAGVDRCVVDCDRDSTADRVIAALAEGLDILAADVDTSDPVSVHAAVSARLRNLRRHTVIVLDNFEVLWEGDRVGAYGLLDELAGLPLLAVVFALRASELPSDFARWQKIPLAGLDSQAAVALFTRSSGGLSDGEAIAEIAHRRLQGVPLAIELVARAAAEQGMTIEELRDTVEQILLSTPMHPGGDRGSSLEASLAISVRHLAEQGRRMLALLGVLPAGIGAADRAVLAERLAGLEIERQATRLSELGLAYVEADGRLRTLKPIRDYSAYAHWPSRPDLEGTRGHYLELVESDAADPSSHKQRMKAENPNFTSMAATLPDRVEHCEALIRQGSAELDAGDSVDARETFRIAAEIARQAREPRLLAQAALGLSGGLEGSGHTLDRADEQRLALLREAAAVLAEDDRLKFRVLTRLLGELHFDASAQAASEMRQLRAQAEALEESAEDEDRLSFALLELASTDAAQDLSTRVARADEVIQRAHDGGDLKTEIKARQLQASLLREYGEADVAETQRAAACALIPRLASQGDRDAAAWQDGVMHRARLLFKGEFEEVRRELADRAPEGDPADSPYRRWLHQNVLLTLDTGRGAISEEEGLASRIGEVDALVVHLREAESLKFGLSKGELGDLAYEWWPTWRVTQAVLRAMHGSASDQQEAHETLRGLATRQLTARGEGDIERHGGLFGRILKHEYYVQVLALAVLALERLSALAAAEAPGAPPRDQWHSMRRNWAVALDRLLAEFDGRAVVPGSGVMDLGSVQAFRAMAKGCAESWSEITGAFDAAREHNERLGGEPALVRTLVADAELHALHGSDQAVERARSVGREAAERARALHMEPWCSRAEALLERLPDG
jgi:hypothetical protein